MSESKFTPGPWIPAGCVVYGADGDSVADLSLNGRRHPDVTEANTRLTAAAPEMFAKLDDLCTMLEEAVVYLDLAEVDILMFQQTVKDIESLLAKATQPEPPIDPKDMERFKNEVIAAIENRGR